MLSKEKMDQLVAARLAMDPVNEYPTGQDDCAHDGPVRWHGPIVECLDCGRTEDRRWSEEYAERIG